MKQVKIILRISFVAILFFLIHIFFKAPSNITTFRRYSSPVYKIDKSLVEDFYKGHPMEQDHLKQEIISSVLDMIEYGKWKDFLDCIQMNMYRYKVLNNESEQLILSLNLSKDIGVAVLFEEVGHGYIFHSKIDDLSPIESIGIIPHPAQDKNLMAIYQKIDESLGSFFRENFVQIYEYTGSTFNLVWEQTISYEEIYKESWIDLQAPDNAWIMVTEDTNMDFDASDPGKVNTTTSFKKYITQSETTPQKMILH